MKRIMISTLAVLAVVATAAGVAYAAPEGAVEAGRSGEPGATAGASVSEPFTYGPYEGTFHGTVYGDRGSRAPLTLELTHRGNRVAGVAYLGEGLYVDAGFCGRGTVPAASQRASGTTVPGNPNRLVAHSTIDVGSFDVNVHLESNVSADSDTLTAKATFDLPWLCGRDPVITGTLTRTDQS